MPDRNSSALRAAVGAHDRQLALLRSLVDEDRWARLGWDETAQILTPDRSHPTLGHAICEADGCWLETRSRNGLCDGCRREWARSPMTDLEAFKVFGVQRRRRALPGGPALCRVCCIPGHERASRSGGLCIECSKRARFRGQSVEEFVAGDARFAAATPRRGYGRCRAASCPAWADTAANLCQGHRRRWVQGGRPTGAAFDLWCRVEPSSRDGRSLSFNLRGMNERVRLEILYGLQVAIDESRNIRGSGVARAVDFIRKNDPESLLDLAGHDFVLATNLAAAFLRFTIGHLQTALGDQDAEAAKDVWNLRVFGFSGALDFSPLSQRWLRETAKQWALVILPTPWAKGSRVGERIAALEVLSRSLASRPDGGVDHRVLGRADIVAFKNRVAHLAAAGTLTRHQHPRVIALVARFLRQAREEGLGREGSPMAGLRRTSSSGGTTVSPDPSTPRARPSPRW